MKGESMTIREHNVDDNEFEPIWRGEQRAEVRLDVGGGGYKDGDVQHLYEVDNVRTGRWIEASIIHVARPFGIADGYVLLSIEVTATHEAP
jgi:hypothetical protein